MSNTPLRYMTPFALVLALAACGPRTDNAADNTGTTVNSTTATNVDNGMTPTGVDHISGICPASRSLSAGAVPR